MNEKDAIEVFNEIMNGSLKQGLDLAGEKMELDTEGLMQLLIKVQENKDMTNEQLIEAYQSLKK
ncbi:hypothetical protein P4645_17200 [Lysinibacillus fusiformis]|uniref:hypothetical protein n=1 Tax=Lysinibacillus fusiformis TaxID=28031 RepID=UPI0000F3910B|nr:hypothetical protein [Lysinibacillus fusiformis]EAZ84911.1 hypothetical protein BB14905_13960 [Bacillus sp. B14905]MED4077951.1 hypothetical protein [Lysinibacillus fusiformis]PCD85070.1 hypothetical protein CNQ87_12230 [Lysinibacillus fusiformis]